MSVICGDPSCRARRAAAPRPPPRRRRRAAAKKSWSATGSGQRADPAPARSAPRSRGTGFGLAHVLDQTGGGGAVRIDPPLEPGEVVLEHADIFAQLVGLFVAEA